MEKQSKKKEQEQFGLGDIPGNATNEFKLGSTFTKKEFHRILDRASQPIKKSDKEKS